MGTFLVFLLGVGVGWFFGHLSEEGRQAPPAGASEPEETHGGAEIVVDQPPVPESALADDSAPMLVQPVQPEVVCSVPAVTYEADGNAVGHTVERHWESRGWVPNGTQLTGYYRTPLGSFEGCINGWNSTNPAFFLINPPAELAVHPHHACFRPRGNGRYEVHFGASPTSVDPGILEIEKVLAEALSKRRRQA